MATTNPNHVQTGLSTNCIECHRVDAFEWTAKGINHDFFPLTKGHDIDNCAACHKTGVTDPISPECYSCHQANYLATTNPSHQSWDLAPIALNVIQRVPVGNPQNLNCTMICISRFLPEATGENGTHVPIVTHRPEISTHLLVPIVMNIINQKPTNITGK